MTDVLDILENPNRKTVPSRVAPNRIAFGAAVPAWMNRPLRSIPSGHHKVIILGFPGGGTNVIRVIEADQGDDACFYLGYDDAAPWPALPGGAADEALAGLALGNIQCFHEESLSLPWHSALGRPAAVAMGGDWRPAQWPGHATLDRLRSFKSWPANWDAEGAPKPDADTIDAATNLLALLNAIGVLPAVQLNAEAQPLFTFHSAGIDGEVTVTSPSTLDFYFHGDDPVAGADVEFNGSRLPTGVTERLSAARINT